MYRIAWIEEKGKENEKEREGKKNSGRVPWSD